MNLQTGKGRQLNGGNGATVLRLLRSFILKDKADTVMLNNIDDAKQLLESIKTARNDWVSANRNFEFAQEQEMVDYYSYKIKAYEVRYQYLIKIAKEKGIRVDILEADNILLNGNHSER